MACNENIIKNVATEVTRNCQTQNVNVEIEFVGFLIDLLLLNPKYGKQFAKSLNRKKLENFVNECVTMLTSAVPCLNTLKMQFVMIMNYDKLSVLLMKQRTHVDAVLKPVLEEIMDADPEDDDEAAYKKLYRKICIYISMASGLGSPSVVVNLKEAMAALESVYDLEELYLFVTLPRMDKMAKLKELLQIVSGVRLYNRDCKLGGEMIPDLPKDLVDASKASLATLCNSLISVMQRVNTLTTAIADRIIIEEETGNIVISVPQRSDLTEGNYKQIFELLIFNRQYEMYARRLLSDVEILVHQSIELQSEVKEVLDEIHATCRFKSAVPVACVFPMFMQLWKVWETMQNTMFLVSTITRLTIILGSIQEHMRIPLHILDAMLQGKQIIGDEERLSSVSYADEASIVNLRVMATTTSQSLLTVVHMEKHVMYLGFCVVCLCKGALVPCNLRLGMMKYNGYLYGFCSYKMASRFSKDPQRYINEVLNYARHHPQIVILLHLRNDVESVRNIDELIVHVVPKTKYYDKDIQTDVHLHEKNIDRNYIWDLWEYKKMACKWATITNCKTHSTQTNNSHMRSEHHCQTVEPRDKSEQTNRDVGIMTNMCNFFYWGLRGQKGYGQHSLDLVQPHLTQKLKPLPVEQCNWPCFGDMADSKSSSYKGSDDERTFYFPGGLKKETSKHDMGEKEEEPFKKSARQTDRTEELTNTNKTFIIANAYNSVPDCAAHVSNTLTLNSVNATHESTGTAHVPSNIPHESGIAQAFIAKTQLIACTNQSFTAKSHLTAGTSLESIAKSDLSAGTVQESASILHTLTDTAKEFIAKSHLSSDTAQTSLAKSHVPASTAQASFSKTTSKALAFKDISQVSIGKHSFAGTSLGPIAKSDLSAGTGQEFIAKSNSSVGTVQEPISTLDTLNEIAQVYVAKSQLSSSTTEASIAQSHVSADTAQTSIDTLHASAGTSHASNGTALASIDTLFTSTGISYESIRTAQETTTKSSTGTVQDSSDTLQSDSSHAYTVTTQDDLDSLRPSVGSSRKSANTTYSSSTIFTSKDTTSTSTAH